MQGRSETHGSKSGGHRGGHGMGAKGPSSSRGLFGSWKWKLPTPGVTIWRINSSIHCTCSHCTWKEVIQPIFVWNGNNIKQIASTYQSILLYLSLHLLLLLLCCQNYSQNQNKINNSQLHFRSNEILYWYRKKFSRYYLCIKDRILERISSIKIEWHFDIAGVYGANIENPVFMFLSHCQAFSIWRAFYLHYLSLPLPSSFSVSTCIFPYVA